MDQVSAVPREHKRLGEILEHVRPEHPPEPRARPREIVLPPQEERAGEVVHFLEAVQVCVLGHLQRFPPHDVPVVALRGLEPCASERGARAVVVPGGCQLEKERAPTLDAQRDIMWRDGLSTSHLPPHVCGTTPLSRIEPVTNRSESMAAGEVVAKVPANSSTH